MIFTVGNICTYVGKVSKCTQKPGYTMLYIILLYIKHTYIRSRHIGKTKMLSQAYPKQTVLMDLNLDTNVCI